MKIVQIDRFKKQRFYIAALIVLSVIALLYTTIGSPTVLWHNRQLRTALTAISEPSVTLDEVVPFDWDEAYSFGPYTSLDTIRETIGTDSYDLSESTSEGQIQLVFLHDGSVTATVCNYPANLGYSVSFVQEGGGGKITNGDATPFAVRQEDGIVCLTEIAD